MYPTTKQIVASNSAGTEFAIAIANIQVGAFERFSALTFNATRTVFEDCAEQAKALLRAKDAHELISLNSAAAQPSIEKAIAYARSMYDVALQAQREMTKVMEAHAREFNTCIILEKPDTTSMNAIPGSGAATAAMKSALAAACSSHESVCKISKQKSGPTKANFTAATQGVKGQPKKNGVKSAQMGARQVRPIQDR